MEKFNLVFDKIILEQLRKAGKNHSLRALLSKMLDKLEELGPRAGKLLDARLGIYELKMKSPPIRLYYKSSIYTSEIYVFEYEMKTSEARQNKTIERIKSLFLKS